MSETEELIIEAAKHGCIIVSNAKNSFIVQYWNPPHNWYGVSSYFPTVKEAVEDARSKNWRRKDNEKH